MSVCPPTLGPAVAAASRAIQNGQAFADLALPDVEVPCRDGMTDLARQALLRQVDEKILCAVLCCCRDSPVVSSSGRSDLRQECVKQTLDVAEGLTGHHSRYKAEISYDMKTEPPTPLMHRGGDGHTRSHYPPARMNDAYGKDGWTRGGVHLRRPDVVVARDPTRPPTRDNLDGVVEMKFPGDRMDPDQNRDYRRIGGPQAGFKVLTDQTPCHCDRGRRRPSPQPVPVAVPERAPAPAPSPSPGLGEALLWTGLTVLAAAATLVAVASPFDGPAGDYAGVTATSAAASRAAAAFAGLAPAF